MMHIVLLILKIIGIILLVVLGILLFLVLALLFVPLRYKVRGEWSEEAKAQARVHWLLHILSFRADYDREKGLLMKLRIFGIPFWKSCRRKPVQEAAKEAMDMGQDVEDTLCRELEMDEKQYRESVERRRGIQSEAEVSQEGRPGKTEERASGPERRSSEGQNGEPQSFLKTFLQKMASRIRNTLKKLRFSFERIYGKLKGINEFVRNKREWLENEKNQASLRFLWKQARRLLAHLWPGKGRGTITFGFEDPYTTGQALQAASLIYPFCHRQLSIYPVFDRQVLEGEGSFQGRIRLGFLLWLAVQIYFDKHTWKLVRGFIK